MATPTQFMLTHKELITLLIRDAGIHEGRWILTLTFGFGPGNFGPTPETTSPGVVVAVNQIGIQRQPSDGPPLPDGMGVDAAEVNPAPKRSGQEGPMEQMQLRKRKRAS
jgi:hypothetical protein